MNQTTTKKYNRILSLVVLFITVLLIIILFEAVLYLLKYDNEYTVMKRFSVEKADWWTNDSIFGPRFVKNEYEHLDESVPDWYRDRLKIVNNQGYHDRDDFTELSADTNLIRVLFVGDSFTWGASSDVDSSYVEVFEKKYKERFPAIVWNTGIPATGTNYALQVTKRFLPLQKSDVVILGFCTDNDFSDNLIPFDRLQFNNKASCFNCYELDHSFNASKITVQDAYKNATGSYPVENLNFFQRRLMIRSRLIPLIHSAFNKIAQLFYRSTHRDHISGEEYSFQITRTYLEQLKSFVEEHNAELIVLIIPEKNDIRIKSIRYRKATEICRDLDIDYLDISDKLKNSNYIQNKYDGHWNNSGHKIAGTLLYKHISAEYEFN